MGKSPYTICKKYIYLGIGYHKMHSHKSSFCWFYLHKGQIYKLCTRSSNMRYYYYMFYTLEIRMKLQKGKKHRRKDLMV